MKPRIIIVFVVVVSSALVLLASHALVASQDMGFTGFAPSSSFLSPDDVSDDGQFAAHTVTDPSTNSVNWPVRPDAIQSLNPQSTAVFTDTTLDVCLSQEPSGLYLHDGSTMLVKSVILSAVYDGPIDKVSYSYQPVILQRLPTLENGDAITQIVTVNAGNTIVNDAGNVVTLTIGQVIRSTGCHSSSCAVTYSGGSVSMERMQATFNLLPGLTWSDGYTLTASDSVYSFNLNGDPATPADKYQVQHTLSYTATSITQTVWIGLPGFTPHDYFIYFWTPLPEHVWGIYSPTQLLSATVSSRTPMGWGPFVIDQWVSGSYITMHRNPNYFRAGEGLPRFDNLIVHLTADPVGGLLSGACDLIPMGVNANVSTLQSYASQGKLRLATAPSNSWEHLDIGIQSAPDYTGFAAQSHAFQDVRVRQALAYCIDRQAIADAVDGSGYGIVANSYLPDSHPYYPPDATVYPFNPAMGRSLLQAAGWVDTSGNGIRDKNGIEFSLYLTTTTASWRIMSTNMISSQLSSNCGIQVSPAYLAGRGLFEPTGPLNTHKFDLALYTWTLGDEFSCELYMTGGSQNYAGYSNPTFDTACNNLRSSLTAADKITYTHQTTTLFAQELPALPLYWSANVGVAAPHVPGFKVDSTAVSLWQVEEVGVGVAAAVSTSGGVLTSSTDATLYTFGAGTFTMPVTVTHTPLSPINTPATGDLTGIGHFFQVAAVDSNGQPVQPALGQTFTITVQFTDAQQSPAIESTVALYYWNNSQWVKEPTSTVYTATNTVTATPNHFSTWAVLGMKPYQVFLPLVMK